MYLINMKISQWQCSLSLYFYMTQNPGTVATQFEIFVFKELTMRNPCSVKCIFLNACSTHMVKSIGKTWQKGRKRNDECSVFYFFVKSKNLCVHDVCIVKMDTGNECWYISLERCQTWKRDISLDVKFIPQSMNSSSASLDSLWAGEAFMLVFFSFLNLVCLYTQKKVFM